MSMLKNNISAVNSLLLHSGEFSFFPPQSADLLSLPAIRYCKSLNLSANRSNKLENRRTFEERDAIETSPERTADKLSFGSDSISAKPLNTSKVIDFFTNDITTRFIENITGNYSFLQEDSFKKYLENCPKRFSTKINFSENEFYYLNVVRSLNTSRDDLKHINYSMFKTQCFLNDVKYTCERIFTNNKNGLCFQKEMNSEDLQTATNENHIRFNGLEIEAEDPRLFIYKNKVYVVFICLSPYENQERCVAITKFEEWNPIFLQVENMKKNTIEKNWSPFIKNEKIHFIYNFDPLIVLDYDLNENGICKVIFKQNNIELPIDTKSKYLRGGTNLLPYLEKNTEKYYIGACHSRKGENDYLTYYTNIVLLNTENWTLEYVSKPLMFSYDNPEDTFNCWHQTYDGSKKKLDLFNGLTDTVSKSNIASHHYNKGEQKNIIIDKTKNRIQLPCNLYMYDNKYYITVNIRDSITFLYEISISKNLLIKNDDFEYEDFIKNILFNEPLEFSL